MAVSTHASAREATGHVGYRHAHGSGFYPRLREGGDPYGDMSVYLRMRVSTHASAREATWMRLGMQLGMQFLPTPPRGRRPDPPPAKSAKKGVSTHASAREATMGRPTAGAGMAVSTHASAREATRK